MKITNKTSLPYKVIGQVIDNYMGITCGDTNYVGKIKYFEFVYKGNVYKCEINYLKNYVEWGFYEKDN